MAVQFSTIQKIAEQRKGGGAALKKLLPEKPLSLEKLAHQPDSLALALMTKNIFRAGFYWQVIDKKWPGFEEAFLGFDPQKVAGLSAAAVEKLAKDDRIVRNSAKIAATVANAAWVLEEAKTHGSFGAMLAAWPADDTVGLWSHLKEKGVRLGGMAGQIFLREMGLDVFILSKPVVAALVKHGVLPKSPTSKKELQTVQDAFNQWRKETGLPLCHLSRILAMSVPD